MVSKKILSLLIVITVLLSSIGITATAEERTSVSTLEEFLDAFNNGSTEIVLNNDINLSGSIDSEVNGLSGSGTEDDPYLINNLEELEWFRDKVDEQASDGSTQFSGKYFNLTTDIDLSGINWEPIGSMSGDHGSFKGVFDGKKADGTNAVISNLNIQMDGQGLGFFARTSGNAEIKNVDFINVTVKSTNNSNYVGSVVANSYESTEISNVHVSGNIDISGRGYIGGISGHGYVVMDNVSVKGEGTISSTFWCAGGILGYGGEGVTNIKNATVEGIGQTGLVIKSAAGGLGAIIGMAEDNEGTQPISGSNLAAKNVSIETYVGGYGTSYSDYALGYLYGGNETSILTGALAVENVTFLTSTGDTNPRVSDAVASIDGKVYFRLESALNEAQDTETVSLLRDAKLSDTLSVEKSITLDGNGFKILPTDKDKVYNSAIMAGNSGWGDDKNTIIIKLKNLDISNWKATYGVVRVQGVSFEMDGCTLSDNTVSNASYSVVSLNFASSVVENSVFENNICPHVIDANFNGDNSAAVIKVENCSFKSNNCSGAGVVYKADGEKIVVLNSKFDSNTVSTNGNAATLYTGWGDGDEVLGCLFKDNTVTTSHATTKRFASAIFCDGCSVNGNAFDNNTATRNGDDVLTTVAVGAYYGAADISDNYWNGGTEPTEGVDYTVEYTRNEVAFDSYYTEYSVDVNGDILLSNKVGNKTSVAKVGDTEYTDLQQAINAANGATVTLLSDVTVSETIRVESDKVITLDLNGYVIDGCENLNIAIMSYGDLTVKDSSVGKEGAVKAGKTALKSGNAINVCGGSFTLESGNIYSVNNAFLIDEQAATVTINGGTITAEPLTRNSAAFYISSTSETVLDINDGAIVGYNGILLWNNTSVNISGGSIDARGSVAIQGNGSKDNTDINISGGSLSGFYTAIYHPQGGSLDITDGELTGWTGVVIKGGTVNISGGTISATGEAAAYQPASSGFVDTGDALYVEHYDNSANSENYGTPTVNVTGGTFTSVNGKAVASYANHNNNVTALDGFITGGTFSSNVSELCADGYKIATKENGTYSVGKLPEAQVSNLGKITVKNKEGDYQFDGSYYVYDLIGGSGLSSETTPFDINIAMQFVSKDNGTQAAANVFGQYTTDFFIKIDGLSGDSFVGDGCYLAGYYPLFGAWVKIPLDGFEIEKGVVYPVISSAGFDFSYVDICTSVQDFICGIYLTDDVIEANPNINVNLTLGLSENIQSAQNGQFEKVDDYTYTKDDLTAHTVAEVNGISYASLEEAFEGATDGSTIKLLSDIFLTASITNTKTVTLDLAGYTVTGTDNTEKNFGLINNTGNLTIDDGIGGGKITLTSTVNSGWNRYSAVISNNPGGILVVNGGTLEHLGGTDMAYGIDSLTNSNIAPVSVTVNGGTIKSTYRGIRQFLNSDNTPNILVINGGTVKGDNKAVFVHDPSQKANVGSITVSENATLDGGVYLFATEGSKLYPVEVSISVEAVGEGNVTTKNIPENYALNTVNGNYTITEVTLFEQGTTSVTLRDSLAINFFINKEHIVGADYYAVVKHYAEDETNEKVIPFTQWDDRGSRYAITYNNLAARQMTDDIEITIYNGDGTQASVVKVDSLRAYALRGINTYAGKTDLTSSERKVLTALVDMLNYGASAQKEFKYREENLANFDTESFQSYATKDIDHVQNIQQKDENHGATTLVLKNSIILTGYFKNVTEDMYAVYTFTNHYGTEKSKRVEYKDFVVNQKYGHGIDVNELVIADAPQSVTITVYNKDGSIHSLLVESINSYLRRAINSVGEDSIYGSTAKFTTAAYNTFHD